MRRIAVIPLLAVFLFTLPVFSFQQRLTSSEFVIAPLADGAGKIYFTRIIPDENYDVWKLNKDGTGLTRVTDDSRAELGSASSMDTGMDFFPGGTKLALIGHTLDNDYIETLNADGSGLTTLYTTSLSIIKLKVSPDGRQIAFVAVDQSALSGANASLYLISAEDGSGIRMLGNNVSAGPEPLAGNIRMFDVGGSTLTKENVYTSMDIAFSSDSGRIAYLDSGGWYINVVSTSGTQLNRYYQMYMNGGLSWTRSGMILFRENMYPDGFLSKIDQDGGGYQILYSTVSAEIKGFAVSPDETKIAVNVGGNSISVIASTGGLLGVIPAGDIVPYRLSWVSDSEIAYAVQDKNIYVADISGVKTNITDNADTADISVWDARNDRIVYTEDYGRKLLYGMDTDGSGRVFLLGLAGGQSIYDASLSPDGTKFLYSVADSTAVNSYKLCVLDTDAPAQPGQFGTILEENAESYTYDDFKWSGTGSKILYKSSDSAYYLIDPDGTDKTRIVPDGDSGQDYDFSPDGSKLVFFGNLQSWGNAAGIYTAEVDLSTYTLVYSTSGYEGSLNLRWRSDTFLFNGYNGGTLFAIDSTGQNLRLVAGDYTYDFTPAALSPDGARAAYQSSTDYKWYVVNLDGTGKWCFAETPYVYFSWSPDGSMLCYNYSSRKWSEAGRLYLAKADGSLKYDLNPSVGLCVKDFYFAADGTLVYTADANLWAGDYISVNTDTIMPKDEGEIKIVLLEGTGERGTINPDSGKEVPIGFKGSAAGSFTLRIFTQLGELVYSETKEVTSAEGWFSWIPGNLASGVYLVSVEGPGVKKFTKIAILR